MDYSLDKKLQCFKQIAQEKLQAVLCSIPNPKDLIIEPTLIKPLEHVCVASWVKSKGVQRIYKFDPKHPAPRQDNVHVYFISANLLVFKHVLDQIHEHESARPSNPLSGLKNYHVIFTPNVHNCFHTLVEEEGLYGIVELHRFNWDFIHLDEGVLSLENPHVFEEVFIRKDTSVLPSIAHSLRVLNMISGNTDMILTFGSQSSRILDIINRLETKPSTKPSDFSAMILIDRDKDYPSCLLTPAIYSGLLLEVFNFRAGELEVTTNINKISKGKLEIFKVSQSPSVPNNKSKPTSIVRMNGSCDEIFGENRYKHFSEASNLVRSQAKALGVEVQNINKMKLNEMHDYVAKKLPKITEMKSKILKHLNVCEEIVNEMAGNFQMQQTLEEDILNNSNRKQILSKIDEILTVDGHKYNILRLVCLTHLSIGLTSDELSTFIRNYCNIFGYKYLHVFQNLTKAGLLPDIEIPGKTKLLANLPNIPIPKFQHTEFQVNANRLKLLSTEPEKRGAEESIKVYANYVFNGTYIPVIAQLASILLKAENIDDINAKLGAMEKIQFHLAQYQESKSLKQIHQAIKKGQLADQFPIKKRTLFIFVVGGVTYAEISACDLVGKMTGSKIVLASNCICSGGDLMAAAF